MDGVTLDGIALPPYARPDLAFQDLIAVASYIPAGNAFVKAAGQYLIVCISAYTLYSSSANAGNRGIFWQVKTQDGTIVQSLPAPAAQGVSTQNSYVAIPNLGTAYGPINFAQAMTLPVVLIQQGWSFGFTSGNFVAGDDGTAEYIVVKIPTGPAKAGATLAPAPVALV